ncbi:MAG: OmpA family protein [Nitrospiraceae bacterium]|nr:MAG: OmpA family protein [Nitrospiraceae bacterium]
MKETPATADCSRCGKDLWTPRWGLAAATEESGDDDNNWLVSFSDVLSLLLVFFIMFFVLTKNPGNVSEEAVPQEQEIALPVQEPFPTESPSEEKKIEQEVASGFTSPDLGRDLSVSSTDREIIVTVGERITFMPGEAELLPGFMPVLDHIAAVLEGHPRVQVDIIGHTDNVPIHTPLYPSNWELSVARATSVLAYFIQERSLDPSRFSVSGYGDQRPTVPNNTPDERAQNRRVEIRLIRAGA